MLKLVLDGSPFGTSDCFSRWRDLYSKMFPDSNYTKLACGPTKATYMLVHDLVPLIKSKITKKLRGERFTIHLDESSYNGKIRLEIWIAYHDSFSIVWHYLSSKELECSVSLNDISSLYNVHQFILI